MPLVSSELNSQYWEPVAYGPAAQADITTWSGVGTTLTTIAASGNWLSNVIVSDGFGKIAVGLKSTQAGAINIQRYIDRAGLVPLTATPDTVSLVANTANALVITDGKPFQSFTIQVTNTGASTATVSNIAILLNAS